jgi:hypothetical protein
MAYYLPWLSNTTGGGGGGAYDSEAQDAYFDGLYTTAFDALTYSGTKYVSTTGSNANNGNSLVNAYASVDYAASQISANGLILVDDGTYTIGTSGWLNSTTGNTPPSGTSTNYTTIRAINPGSVTLNQASQSYYGSILRLTGGARIWVDGFNFTHDDPHPDEAIFYFGADNSRLTRCMFRRRQSGTYGATLYLGVGCLVQDVALYGAGRYMCNTGSNSGNSVAGTNVFRRVVARLDWALCDQPVATFAHYGSDDGGYVDSKQTLWANCVDIDGPAVENQASFGFKWGSFYHPKHQRDIRHKGCIVLNAGCDLASFRTDNIGSPTMSAENCAIWDNDNNTQSGQSPIGFAVAAGSMSVTNCFGGQILGADTSGTTNTNNRFTDSPTSPQNIVQRSGSTGAEILYCHGAFLSHWGETNFDTVTTDPLWPWPYESRIKSWLDTQITKPSAHFPASPTSSRQSFTGTSINGDEMTLTRRVWEAAGAAIPDLSTIY